ncbi:MAG: hypothetical protein PHR35_07160 [Kiritimatiellae bacterium]|nr:hypothetical protein [Kiritimatiellia bacterium]
MKKLLSCLSRNRAMYRGGLIGVTVVAMLLTLPARVNAANCYWDAGGGVDQGWLNADNWSDQTLPTSVDDAVIGATSYAKDATGTISAAGAVCSNLLLGTNSNTRGTLQVTGGDLRIINGMIVGVYGTGLVFQTGGDISIDNGGVSDTTFSLGNYSSSTGYYEMAGGTLTVTNGIIGVAGCGEFRQTGGTNRIRKYFFLGRGGGSRGIYELSGGVLHANSTLLGEAGAATFRQTGGVFTNSGSVGAVVLGNSSSGTGIYELVSGVLTTVGGPTYGKAGLGIFTQTGGTNSIGSSWAIGVGGRGTYNYFGGVITQKANQCRIGYSGGSGTLNIGTNSDKVTLIVPGTFYVRAEDNNACQGTLHGWGTIGGGGMTMNGRVVADGYGSDRDLDLSGFGTINAKTASHTFTSTNGWFAQDHGAVKLKSVPYASVNCWGDTATCWGNTTANQPLVNSVRFAYTSGSGNLTGSLLATDHGDVPSGLFKPVAVWNFSGPTFTTCELTIRYDDVAAASAGIPESDLKVYQYVNGAWKDITGSVTTGTKQITAHALSPISRIAVDNIPPRGTVVMFL